jgi:Fe-S-cluster containining protein
MIPLPVIDSCDNCGLCCETQAGLPISYYTAVEPNADLPAYLRREIEETARRWNGLGIWQVPGHDAPCVWYDQTTRRCRHYEHRPSVCREFERGSACCREYRREGGLSA